MAKIWVVKHALSKKGIFEIDAEIEENGFVSYRGKNGRVEYLHGEGREWSRTENDAIAAAKTMRSKRVGTLTRSIARLTEMSFGGECHG